MKRIAVIAIALTTFTVGLNVGRYVESVKSAPVINVTVNGVSTETNTDQEVTCKVRDFYRNHLPVNFEFKTTKNKLTSLERHSKIYGMEVADVRNKRTDTMLFLNDDAASGGMVIAICEYE